MGTVLAAIVTLGTGVIVASIIYQLVVHPAGTQVLVGNAANTAYGITNTLFK